MKRKRSFITIAMATIVLVSLCAVCTSTSTSAASSSASVKASPNLVGNPIAAGTSPSACMPKDFHYLYLFVQGYDGALWYNRQDLVTQGLPNWGWSGWTSLGGQLTSSPCAVSRSSGCLDVYVRSTDGAVWERPYYNGAWHGWVNIGGQLAPGTGPGASGWPSREDLFVVGTNGALLQKTWTASGWSGWASLGGVVTSSPAAVSRGTGLIDVHARGTSGADYEESYYNGAWHGWVNIGGVVASGTGPALGVWSSTNTIYLLVTGTDGAMWQKTWTAASGWSGWRGLGGHLTSSPTIAWSSQFYALEVYARGTDSYLYLDEYYSGVWHGWRGGTMQGPPGAL
jgi:hypothetical protein